MPILDGEHIGRPDPQDKPLDMVAVCACGCRQRIFFGDEGVWEYDGDLFASAECFARWSGAERMDAKWS
jgi:hypothetical protein